MSWQTHIRKVHCDPPETYLVDAEMRQVIGEYITEHFGICCGVIDFSEVGQNYCKVEINLADSGGHASAVCVELIVHNSGRIEQTFVIYPDERSDRNIRHKLPDGLLPPDNEDFAAMVAKETADTWRNRAVGWHSAHEQIFEVMSEYVNRNGCEPVVMIGGFYPDGTDTCNHGDCFPLNPKGIRQALAAMRADLKGGQAWQESYTGEQDAGDFSIMLLPGRGGPPEDDSYFFLDPKDGYKSLVSNIDDNRWDNILPM